MGHPHGGTPGASAPERPACSTCIHWADSPAHGDRRECRAGPPVAVGLYQPDPASSRMLSRGQWPPTLATDGCGHHPDFPAWLAEAKPSVTVYPFDEPGMAVKSEAPIARVRPKRG